MPKKINISDLHNQNCFRYLQILAKKLPKSVLEDTQNEELISKIKHINSVEHYSKDLACADLYTDFLNYLEENIIQLFDQRRQDLEERLLILRAIDLSNQHESLQEQQEITKELADLDEFIFTIYANDNYNLDHVYTEIEPFVSTLKKSIKKYPTSNKHALMPLDVDHPVHRFKAIFIDDNFKPQYTTSLATVRYYRHQNKNWPTEYRIGTQGQYHEKKPRLSPLFERWVGVLVRKYSSQTRPILHLYINNLGLDRKNTTEGQFEKALSLALHQLEDKYDYIGILTLPADKHLLNTEDYKKIQPEFKIDDVIAEFNRIATQEPNLDNNDKDFYISPRIKKLLFPGKTQQESNDFEKEKISELINSSVLALGFMDRRHLSASERNALWFHFVKFELTDYIIQTLKPCGFNISCKDAIDRAAVSSAYYNLLKSFNTDTPMTEAEFQKALDAAAVMVKGRPINHQIYNIWNALYEYGRVNYRNISQDNDKKWLIDWLITNCPQDRTRQARLFKDYLKEEAQIAREKSPQSKSLVDSFIDTTFEILDRPTQEKAEQYEQTLEEVKSLHPILDGLVHVAKLCIGALLYGLSFIFTGGQAPYSTMFDSGLSFFSSSKKAVEPCVKAALVKDMP